MKPSIREKVDEITLLMDQLRAAAVSAVEELDAASERHEEMQKEQWRQRKELATLTRSADEISGLQDQNARLRTHVDKLRDSLQALLANVKSLRNEFRP